MNKINFDNFFKISAKVLVSFEESETLMSICRKSLVSYPTIIKVFNDLKARDIIVKNGKHIYNLTEKGMKVRDLLKNALKEFNLIVKPAHKDARLRGGQHGRKK